jgi:hydrogenase maturation protease
MPLLDSTLVGEPFAPTLLADAQDHVLILGVGNVLMGDEGVGVHVLRALERLAPQAGVRLLDGGTGGVNLLSEFDGMSAVLLVDATYDGLPPGTITHLQPTRVADLPRGLGAHDFGLKDLFAAAALLGRLPKLHVFTISIATVEPMCTVLSPAVAASVIPAVTRLRRIAPLVVGAA